MFFDQSTHPTRLECFSNVYKFSLSVFSSYTMIDRLCGPALIYFFFSITHVLVDTGKGLYNSALMKLLVTILFTIFLNYLCSSGLQLIAWFIVFIPFILMTLIISILLYVFGIDPKSGMIKFDGPNTNTTVYPDPRANVPNHDESTIGHQRNAKHVGLYPGLLPKYIESDYDATMRALRAEHTTDNKTAGDMEKEKQEERKTQQNKISSGSTQDGFAVGVPAPYAF